MNVMNNAAARWPLPISEQAGLLDNIIIEQGSPRFASRSEMSYAIFSEHYQQAVAEGKFTFKLDKPEDPLQPHPFSLDFRQLLSLMQPGIESVKAPSLNESQEWLLLLLQDHSPDPEKLSDEGRFLSHAFNNFILVYKDQYNKLFEKLSDEMMKPRVPSWD